jgi:aspartate kinase
LIGEAIGAAEVVFWKDVVGVMSADPALVPGARTLREISYAEAAEFTRHGASVLHAAAAAPLERSRVPARVTCVHDPDDRGTRIEGEPREHRNVGVACRRGVARFVLEGESDRERVVGALARAGIQALHVGARPDSVVVVALWSDELARTLLSLGRRAQVERDLALVAAVGNAFDPASVDRQFAGAELQVREYWLAGERGTTVYLVAEAQLARTANAVHAALFELTSVSGGSE